MLSTTLTLLALGATATSLLGQSDTLNFTYVAAGGRNTCAIAPRGVAYCWGANDQGQLGDGDRLTESKRQPTQVATEHRFLSLAVGGRFACGVTVDSLAFCWGANRDGQLGNGTTDHPDLHQVGPAPNGGNDAHRQFVPVGYHTQVGDERQRFRVQQGGH